MDADALWFLAARGLGTSGTVVDRAITFCTWTVMDPDRPLFVPDARGDERFSANPFVLEGTICSYAGFPLVVDGQAIGTMCVHDPAPGRLTEEKLDSLRVLAGAARTQLALTRHVDVLSLLARTDPLTGAANRRAINEAVERELHRAARSGALSPIWQIADHESAHLADGTGAGARPGRGARRRGRGEYGSLRSPLGLAGSDASLIGYSHDSTISDPLGRSSSLHRWRLTGAGRVRTFDLQGSSLTAPVLVNRGRAVVAWRQDRGATGSIVLVSSAGGRARVLVAGVDHQ